MMVSKQICRKSCSSIVKPCFHVTCPSSQVKECRMGTCPGRVFSNCYSPTLYCFSWSICRFTHSQGWICNHLQDCSTSPNFFPFFPIFLRLLRLFADCLHPTRWCPCCSSWWKMQRPWKPRPCVLRTVPWRWGYDEEPTPGVDWKLPENLHMMAVNKLVTAIDTERIYIDNICIHVYRYTCKYVCMYLCIYVYVFICLNVYMYMCI